MEYSHESLYIHSGDTPPSTHASSTSFIYGLSCVSNKQDILLPDHTQKQNIAAGAMIHIGRYSVGFSTECSCESAASSLRNSSKMTIAKRVSVETFFPFLFLVKDFSPAVWTLGLVLGRGSSEESMFILELFLFREELSLSCTSPSSDIIELCLISRETICCATDASNWEFLTWAL